ncbi:MAG TPA: anti-sigma factor [Gaiellaceae bacterium]|jgi:anti-sigma-K factor RskA
MEDAHSLVAPYALDALDEREEREFELHLATCERCREELAGLREAAASLAYGATGPAPPAALKERILTQARAERTNVVSLPRRRGWAGPVAAAAALAAAVALGFGVWSATRPAGNDAFTSVLARPGSKLLPMGSGGAVAVAPDGTAALAVTVQHAPEGKTYEAWVIRNGQAQRAGLFSDATSIRIERPVTRGSLVAVTLERAGGVDQPTQSPLMATRALS